MFVCADMIELKEKEREEIVKRNLPLLIHTTLLPLVVVGADQTMPSLSCDAQ